MVFHSQLFIFLNEVEANFIANNLIHTVTPRATRLTYFFYLYCTQIMQKFANVSLRYVFKVH